MFNPLSQLTGALIRYLFAYPGSAHRAPHTNTNAVSSRSATRSQVRIELSSTGQIHRISEVGSTIRHRLIAYQSSKRGLMIPACSLGGSLKPENARRRTSNYPGAIWGPAIRSVAALIFGNLPPVVRYKLKNIVCERSSWLTRRHFNRQGNFASDLDFNCQRCEQEEGVCNRNLSLAL